MPTQLGTGAKLAVVCAGYAAACIASYVAAYAYDAHMAAQPYDTSGGMYAGGEMLTALGVFGVVACVPTVLALWFLRQQPRVWNGVGWACVGFAALGAVAVAVALLLHGPGNDIGLALLELLALSQLLGVPLWAAGFGLLALLAPERRSRRLLLCALALELAIGIAAAVHWFTP